MKYVDTHCHLNFHSYKIDLFSVIQRALDVGVERIITPGLNLETSREVVEIADQVGEVYAAVGIHPSDVDTYHESQLPEFEELIAHPKVVAIGEIGLDYHYRKDNHIAQQRLLSTMLDLAEKYQKPIILHSRESLPDLVELLRSRKSLLSTLNKKGIFHAFEGNTEEAIEVCRMGFLLGAGGPLTYGNAKIKQDVFSTIDLDKIVLETDGPFLSPVPYRGTRNEPSRIPIIAEKLASLRQIRLQTVVENTTRNVKLLLDWN